MMADWLTGNLASWLTLALVSLLAFLFFKERE